MTAVVDIAAVIRHERSLLTALLTRGVCSCGCGASLDGKRSSARYASNACRQRAWKARAGYRRERRVGDASERAERS